MQEKFEQKIPVLLEKAGKKGMTYKELSIKCRVKKEEGKYFRLAVQKCKSAGLVLEKKGKFFTTQSKGLYPAVIKRLHKTYGFAERLEQKDEVFILGSKLKGALAGDKVMIRLSKHTRGNLPEGEVISFIEAGEVEFTGIAHLTKGGPFITPDDIGNFDLRLEGSVKGVADGDKVTAKITKRGQGHRDLRAKVVKSFGQATRAAACCEAILNLNGVTPEFPPQVLEEAKFLAQRGIKHKELLNREDLRSEVIFTIDGADSKDLDDAISLSKYEDFYVLGVHIADVSYYVREKTALDEEALRRGTSIYYANKVVPMLPKELSNGICSLNPDEERLAFSAIITLSKDGKIVDYDFKKSVICSRVKGVYSEVNEIIAGTAGEEILKKYRDVLHVIPLMKELSDILHSNRKLRGAPDIDTAESKLILDTNDRIVDVVPRQRGEAEEMIEEFMLTANEAAATLAKKLQIPFVYRVHEYPDGEKLNVLKETMQALGLPAREIKGNVPSKVLSDILDEAKGKPFYPIVSRQVLRSMAKAKYSETPIGHYGLALENYAHFTSPIRRYPDLTIHRILSDVVTQKRSPSDVKKRYSEFVGKSANASTEAEIAAMKVERDCEDCYKAEYMESHVGESFDGMITSVTSFGFYVGLPNTVEGLVRIEDLADGQYQYDGLMELKEIHTGKAFRVGDAVRVTCSGVDVNAGNIDFVPADPESCENS